MAKTAHTRKKKQAVVVIHGMGQQRPMDTLRSFVKTVWNDDLPLTGKAKGRKWLAGDGNPTANKSWVVPDERTGSHELRRITTPYDVNDRRTDFYELYWADLTQKNLASVFLAWLRILILRWPWAVPRNARAMYVLYWVVVILAVLPPVVLWLTDFLSWKTLVFSVPVWGFLYMIVQKGFGAMVLPILGDVATYLHRSPETVATRAKVRNRGLSLLKELMDDDDYDRIVVVAHSLGSLVGYDLLQILWHQYGPSHRNPRKDPAVKTALTAVDKFTADNDRGDGRILTPEQQDEFRQAQYDVYKALRTKAVGLNSWKISDFVTMGSPLSHAEFLMTYDHVEWEKGVRERLYATCPPASDSETRRTIRYGSAGDHVHHGSVFAATRWTNLHDSGRWVVFGDPFSGPMEENFNNGVKDIAVQITRGVPLGTLMTHTLYWNPTGKADTHLDALREALDLRRKLDP